MREQENPNRPRFGTFITMVVGVLLAFGFLSQAHRVLEPEMDSPAAATEQNNSLKQRRQREMMVIGIPVNQEAEQTGRAAEERLEMGTPARRQAPSQPQRPRVSPQPNRYTAPPPQARRDRFYMVRGNGETLYGIARKIYGNGNQWQMILNANPDLKSPRHIRAGMRLRIPNPDTITPQFQQWMSSADAHSTPVL